LALGLRLVASIDTDIEATGSAVEPKDVSGSARANPVALEVNVSVAGARPGAGSGSRDLFSEETTTVVVFRDGAVIRLAVEVSVGQLLFLTNKKNNQEVVCEVTERRKNPAGASYVKLQFTEVRENFWGVAFPVVEDRSPRFMVPVQAGRAEAPVKGAESAHNAGDAERLKKEVQALREQLVKVEKKNAEEAAAKAAAETAAREAAAREATMREAAKFLEEATGKASKGKEELAPVNEPSEKAANATAPAGKENADLLMPRAASKEKTEVARPVIGMSLPVWKSEKSPVEQLLEEEAKKGVKIVEGPEGEGSEELLPEPELDFSQIPVGKNGGAHEMRLRILGLLGSPKTRVVGLCAALAMILALGTWYGNWWKYLPIGKKTEAAAGNAARPVAAGTVEAVSANTGTGGTNAAAENPAGNEAKKDSVEKSGGVEKAPVVENEVAAPREEKASVAREKAAAKKEAVVAAAADETAAPATETAAAVDAPLVPAKLLKAVNPVYPADAMLQYITGDVKAEVVVGAAGQVGEVKVISGPAALREAAVEALRKYEYAPATVGGKGVESRVTAVVKFWFNP
jgi:TonB family protein